MGINGFENEDNLYKMSLNEVRISKENGPSDVFFTTIMRVPGGWIYRMVDKGTKLCSCCFVPFNNEFQKSVEWPPNL